MTGPKPAGERLFTVRQEGKWGYIDRTGKLVIAPQYDEAWEFSEGLAYVRVGKQRFIIDRAGKTVIELQQVDITGNFSEGFAPVQTGGPQPRRDIRHLKGPLATLIATARRP